jgi:hypothetical protein
MSVALLLFISCFVIAQDDNADIPEPTARPTLADPTLPDVALPEISKALAGISSRDFSVLRSVLHAADRRSESASLASPNIVTEVSDLDHDGAPGALLQWALPDTAAPDVAADPDSKPAWNLYFLSWDGTKWLASRLLSGVEEFRFEVIHLGPPAGNALAIVLTDAETHQSYPVIFGFKAHTAALLWDGESEESRYEPLLQGEISFLDQKGAPTELLVTGRADPGFFQVARNGKRGFTARAFYRWQENAFVPEHTEYTPGPDYTVYRFISALHLHQYAAAYALIVPAKFMKTDSPSLDKFRQFVQQNWPEFLQDEIFTAPDLPPGLPDQHLFLLDKPDKHLTYHPAFTHDGKFRLTGLYRSVESLPDGSEIKN